MEESPSDTTPAAYEPSGFGWTPAFRATLAWAGIAVPIACVVCGLLGMASPSSPWQSGEWDQYAAILLAEPTIPFWPLLIYSMISLALVLIDFRKWSERDIVRWGIYSGVWLALHFELVVLVAGGPELIMIQGMLSAFALVVVGVMNALSPRDKPAAAVAIAWAIGAVFLVTPLVVVTVMGGALWALLTYLYVARHVWLSRRGNRLQYSLSQLLGAFTWLAGYCGAWRLSYAWMLAEYSKLPLSQPQCFIATAAAQGHRRFVRAERIVTAGGQPLWANDQLRYLKAAELILAHSAPRVHRRVRSLYSRLGPPLARRLSHPVLADAAYLALKPAEWLARMILSPATKSAARQLYR